MTSVRNALSLFLVAAAMLALAACQPFTSANTGDPATWRLTSPSAVSAGSSEIDIEVTRLGCASGVTGEVLAPQVTYEEEQIVIRVDVARVGSGAQNCQGNDAVPVTVDLSEPVGDRAIIDGGCALEGVGTTAECAETAVRFPTS